MTAVLTTDHIYRLTVGMAVKSGKRRGIVTARDRHTLTILTDEGYVHTLASGWEQDNER